MLGKLCRTANWLCFQTEPLSGTARFGRYRVSNCPFHMSINRTCAAHRAVYITNRVQTVHLLRHCRAPTSAVLSFTHITNKCSCLLRLSIAPWTLAIRSFFDITKVERYSNKLTGLCAEHKMGDAYSLCGWGTGKHEVIWWVNVNREESSA